jgi:hypothetical protein
LRTVHDFLDGHFIPEVAIHSKVENIFKMPRSHAVTKWPRFDEKWPRVSLDNLCLHQNALYSSLLEFLDASDMVKSDHDCYMTTMVVLHI